MVFSIIFFAIIGIINFFVSIIRGIKKLEKEALKKAELKKQLEEKEQKKIEENNIDTF